MYNPEILKNLEEKYGTEKTADFCEMISTMYNLKYENCTSQDCRSEYDYERDWWHEQAINLKLKKNGVTLSGI